LEEFLDHGGVNCTVAIEANGLDGGDDLREARDGVGDGGDGAAEGGREEDGVKQGAVGAYKENPRIVVVVRVRVRVRFCDFWGWVALNYDTDAKGPKGIVDQVHGEEGTCGHAKAC